VEDSFAGRRARKVVSVFPESKIRLLARKEVTSKEEEILFPSLGSPKAQPGIHMKKPTDSPWLRACVCCDQTH